MGFAAGVSGLAVANLVVGRRLAQDQRLRERETAQIRRLQAASTPGRVQLAKLASAAGGVPASIVHGLAAVVVLERRTQQPRIAARPAVALIGETLVYLVAGALVGRERPAVPRLDHEQPTSSFPSGHLGASAALAITYALLARHLHSPAARLGVRAGALAWPSLLAWSRIQLGMHFPSDVAVGAVNGLASGLLAAAALGTSGS